MRIQDMWGNARAARRERSRAIGAALLFLTAALVGCLARRDVLSSALGAGRANAPRRAIVGTSFQWDAAQGDVAFGGNTQRNAQYTVTLSPAANGLTSQGSRVQGVPTAPGVITAIVVATDRSGHELRDSVAIVAFAPGLAAPTLPARPYSYAAIAQAAVTRFAGRGPGAGRGGPPGGPAGGGAFVGGGGRGGRGGGRGGRGGARDNAPDSNAVTDAGATLGRVLFYDRRLSANDKIACASCHVQAFGFADTARLSLGFDGGRTRRHSMALANARLYTSGRFFWDERAGTLEAQTLMPLQDAVEMGMTLPALEAKLNASAFYAPLFKAAFGTPDVTSDRVARALAQFVRSLVSTESRFDRGALAAGGLTAQERDGLRLFNGQAGCARCHVGSSLSGDGTHNTGLDSVITDVGAGRGRFKVPSLRNVAVRPPYMHDGRFTTLEQVVDHYDGGVKANPDLDQRLRSRGGALRSLGLSAAQKAALVAYMGALTDSTFLHDPRFADPFAAVARR